jgi:lysophospholipase L1-like esterase
MGDHVNFRMAEQPAEPTAPKSGFQTLNSASSKKHVGATVLKKNQPTHIYIFAGHNDACL